MGFIHGEIYFVDDSILHLREFVDVETMPHRLTDVSQDMAPVLQLVFRYDNTGHHRTLHLPTSPHHTHEGSEDNVVASPAPDLVTVLSQIAMLVQLPC